MDVPRRLHPVVDDARPRLRRGRLAGLLPLAAGLLLAGTAAATEPAPGAATAVRDGAAAVTEAAADLATATATGQEAAGEGPPTAEPGAAAEEAEPVPADPDAPPPPEADSALLAALDHPEWAVREAATQRLRRSRTLDPETVLRLVREHELSLEARSRLLLACHDTFVTAPLGALGVRHMQVDDGAGTVVSDVIAGFDAARVIRPQDLLLSIDDMELGGFESLAAAVQRRRPGDVVVVELRRPRRDGNAIRRHPRTGEVVYGPPTRVEVRLGSFDSLPGGDWSNRPLASDVPIERRLEWRAALRSAGARPRVLELPDETGVPAPRDDDPGRRRIR